MPTGTFRAASPADAAAGDALAALAAGVPQLAHLRLHKAWDITVPATWWGWRARRIDDAHLLLLRGGRGVYRIAGEEVALRRGRLVVLWGDLPYDADADADDPPQVLSFRFAPYRHDGRRLPLPPAGSRVGEVARGHPLEGLLAELARRHGAGDPDRLCPSLLHHALVLAREALADQHADPRISRALRLVDENPGVGRPVAELAAIAGLSVPHFTALFRAATGMPPRRYLAEARLHHARWLVEHSDRPLAAIAEDLGFSDRFSFTRQFSRLHGVAPAACRRAAAAV